MHGATALRWDGRRRDSGGNALLFIRDVHQTSKGAIVLFPVSRQHGHVKPSGGVGAKNSVDTEHQRMYLNFSRSRLGMIIHARCTQ